MPAERKKEFKPRRNYCIMSEGASEAIPFLKKVSKDAGNVLLVTSAHPNKLKEDYGLEGMDVMWVTDEPSKEIKSVAPGRMKFELSKDLLTFIASNDKGIIFLEGIEFLIQINGFDEVLKFVKQILDKSSGRGITAMVSINPKSIAEAQFMMFRNRFDDSGWTTEFKLAGESDYDIPHLPNFPIMQKAGPEQPPKPSEPEKKKEPVEASEEEEEKKRPGSSKRAPTGVPGFDVLIEGGIPRGSAVLLQGPPGVERDSFWIQFIAEALRAGESAIVTVSSTSPDELRIKFKNFGMDLKKFEDEKKIIIIDWYSYRNERILGIEERGAVYRCSKGLTNLEIAMTKAMRVSMVKGQRTCAVIDVLSPAITSLKFDPVYKFAQALRAKFRKYTVTAMFLLDRGTHEKEQVASLHQVFDGAIDIERERVGTKMERHVAVLAMEGTYFETEYFPLGLTKEKGIHVIGTERMEVPKEEAKPVAPPKIEKKEAPKEEVTPVVAPRIEKIEAPKVEAEPVPQPKIEIKEEAQAPRPEVKRPEIRPEARRDVEVEEKPTPPPMPKEEPKPVRPPEPIKPVERPEVIPAISLLPTPRVSEINGKKKGLINGQRKRVMVQRRAEARRRQAVIFRAVLAVCLLSVSSAFVLLMVAPEHKGIVVDGNIGDWSSAIVFDEGRDSNLAGGEDIVKYSTQKDGDTRFFYVGMGANPFPPKTAGNETATILILIDIDGASGTGYSMKGFGVDALVTINGWEGEAKGATILRFPTNPSDKRNWSAFEAVSSTTAANSDGDIEVGIANDGIVDSKAKWTVGFFSTGAEDRSKVAVGMERKGALLVEQTPQAMDTISGKVNILDLKLTAFGRGVTVDQMPITLSEGTVTPVSVPISITPGSSITRHVEIDASSVQDGHYVHAEVASVSSDGYATVTGDGFASYAKSLPDQILIDGAMGDWNKPSNIGIEVNDSKDQVPGSVDIRQGKTSCSVPDGMAFYVSVFGEMMAGALPYSTPPRPSGGGGGGGPVILPKVSGEDLLRIYIDSEENDTIGEYKNGLWVDRIIEVRGKEGVVTSAIVEEYVSGDWKTTLTSFAVASHGGDIELAVSNTTLKLISWRLYFEMTDWSGENDFTTWRFRFDQGGGTPTDADTMITETSQSSTLTISSPTGRIGAAMASDPNGNILLFGGHDGTNYLGDTWYYSASENRWENLNPSPAPVKRSGATMVYLRTVGLFLLFGGFASPGGRSNETWTFNLGTTPPTWTSHLTYGSITARNGHAMVYDTSNDKVILFGGLTSSLNAETWAFNYPTMKWTNMAPVGTPPTPRYYHAMAYDMESKLTLLFGGGIPSSVNDMYSYDYISNKWSSRSTGPSARQNLGMAYDEKNDRVLVFGGAGTVYNSDTWAYDTNTDAWINKNIPTAPNSRGSHMMVYCPYTSTSIMFGGKATPYYQDTWSYRYSENRWARLDSSGLAWLKVKAADLNHDGMEEIVAVGVTQTIPSYGMIQVSRWNGASYSYPANSRVVHSNGGDDVFTDVAAGDVDNDGQIEVVVVGDLGVNAAVAVFNWTEAMPNNGFKMEAVGMWNHGTGTQISSVDLKDVDNDGRLEIVTTGQYVSASKGLQITETLKFRKQGSSLIETAQTYFDPSRPIQSSYDLAIADADMDGMPETFTGGSYGISTSSWKNVSTIVGPGARYLSAMAYDPVEKKIVLFGGSEIGAPRNDTWEYDLRVGLWARTTVDGSPGAPTQRYGHDMVYVPSMGEVLLYGGLVGAVNSPETWAYSTMSHKWRLISSGPNPPARRFHKMVYDSVADKVILFGGWTTAFQQDTWEFNPQTGIWRNLFPTNKPSPRGYQGMAYDSVSNKIVIFGGFQGNLFDTWLYDHDFNNWTNANPSAHPEGRYDGRMCFDTYLKRMVLFGGYNSSSGRFLNSTWSYDLPTNTWTDVASGTLPSARRVGAATYVSDSGRMYIFGAYNSAYKNDTWYHQFTTTGLTGVLRANENQPPSWSQRSLPGNQPTPSKRELFAMAYDSASDKVVLFGGDSNGAPPFFGDTWLYDIPSKTWTHKFPASSPSGRQHPGMVYMSKHDKVLLFGGYDGALKLDDTWIYDIETNNWSKMNIASPPKPRDWVSHAMVYLEKYDTVLLFGGQGQTPTWNFNDIWRYDLNSNLWTNITPVASYTKRYGQTVARAGDDKVVIFGGRDSGYLSDTWIYDYPSNTVVLVATPVFPPARYGHTMDFDSLSNRILMYGGFSGSGFMPDTWEYDYLNNVWSSVGAVPSPSARAGPKMVFAPLHNLFFLFGGWTGVSGVSFENWTFSFSPFFLASSTTWWDSGIHEITAVNVFDLNGDGWPDVITGGYQHPPGAASVDHPTARSYNYTAGSFIWDLTHLNTLVNPWGDAGRVREMFPYDVDRDGKPELAITGNITNSGYLTILNKSAGEYEYPWLTGLVTAPFGVTVDDVDRDGVPEIITVGLFLPTLSECDAQLNIFNWNIVWPPIPELVLEKGYNWTAGTGVYFYAVDTGDVDHDGVTEIVVVGRQAQATTRAEIMIVSWSNGVFTVEKEYSWFLTGNTYLYGVGIGDVDLDGTVEIVIGGYNYSGSRFSGMISILAWSGIIGDPLIFEGTTTWWDNAGTASTYVRGLKVSDVDRDGVPEIITAGYVTRTPAQGQVAIYRWNGVTAIREAMSNDSSLGQATYYYALAVDDFDMNGVIDILCAGYSGNGAGGWNGVGVFYTSDGSTISLLAQFWPSGGDGTNTRLYSVTYGDVDGDGVIELMMGGSYANAGLSYGYIDIVYRYQGATWGEAQNGWQVLSASTYAYGISTGDPDRDGSLNIITTGYANAATASAFLEIWDYPGFGLLYEKVWYNVSSTFGYALVVCDVDQDGTIEMIVAGYHMWTQYRGGIWIWRLGVPEFGYQMIPVLMMSVPVLFVLVERKRRMARRRR